jgi:hypothetical protein
MHLGIPTGLLGPLRFVLLIRLTSFLVDCFVLLSVRNNRLLSVVSPSAIVVTEVISSFWTIVLKLLVHMQMGSMTLLHSLLVSEIHSQNSYKTQVLGWFSRFCIKMLNSTFMTEGRGKLFCFIIYTDAPIILIVRLLAHLPIIDIGR